MRRPLVMGNWKMHLNGASAESLAREITEGFSARGWDVEVGVCPPNLYLQRVAGVVRATDVVLGAQNGHWADKGAFTGEVSMAMLVDVGCDYVIIGHSERRLYFGEQDSLIRKKVAAGLSGGLHVILCVGETEPQRDEGVTEDIIDGQLDGALTDLSVDSAENLAIAYEPVWAIGTGKTATPEQAQHVHAFIRRWVARGIAPGAAEDIRILYGGSVKPDNMASLISMPDIDGALVGGASLRSDSFLGIARHAAERGR